MHIHKWKYYADTTFLGEPQYSRYRVCEKCGKTERRIRDDWEPYNETKTNFWVLDEVVKLQEGKH